MHMELSIYSTAIRILTDGTRKAKFLCQRDSGLSILGCYLSCIIEVGSLLSMLQLSVKRKYKQRRVWLLFISMPMLTSVTNSLLSYYMKSHGYIYLQRKLGMQSLMECPCAPILQRERMSSEEVWEFATLTASMIKNNKG